MFYKDKEYPWRQIKFFSYSYKKTRVFSESLGIINLSIGDVIKKQILLPEGKVVVNLNIKLLGVELDKKLNLINLIFISLKNSKLIFIDKNHVLTDFLKKPHKLS